MKYHYIDTRKYSEKKAYEWFKEEYEDRLAFNELYEITNPEENQPYLREKYQDIFEDKVDEIEDELLTYERTEEA